MSSNAADHPPAIEFHPWPRPLPPRYLALARSAVLLVLGMILLMTVLPGLSLLTFVAGAVILVTLLRRARQEDRRRDAAPE